VTLSYLPDQEPLHEGPEEAGVGGRAGVGDAAEIDAGDVAGGVGVGIELGV